MRKIKVCIVSPYSYPLFNPSHTKSHFGGWEVRASIIAKGLAKQGQLDISVIVWDHGQEHIEHWDGVTLYSWIGRPYPLAEPSPYMNSVPAANCAKVTDPVRLIFKIKSNSLKSRLKNIIPWRFWNVARIMKDGSQNISAAIYNGLREFYRGLRAAIGIAYRTSRSIYCVLFRSFGKIDEYIIPNINVAIYDEIDADVYIVPGNHDRAAEVAYFCRARGKKYIFLAGSDMDYSFNYRMHPEKIDVYGIPGFLMTYAIENASLHLVQSEHQAQLLKADYGHDSIIIRNPIDLKYQFPKAANSENILWVGSSDDRVRRPSLALELARCLPEYSFVMIITPAVLETYEKCHREARDLPNVTLIGRVPFDEVEKYFATAKLFINTSVFEGFPNTFLQAGKYGIPIVALKVDPGQMLTLHGCGATCNDHMDKLIEQVRLYMSNSEKYEQASGQCLTYVSTYHDKEKIVLEYERVIQSLLR